MEDESTKSDGPDQSDDDDDDDDDESNNENEEDNEEEDGDSTLGVDMDEEMMEIMLSLYEMVYLLGLRYSNST
ncbi:hypothetical protein Tco_0990004 [Tanacetum coccineum]|uniref:Uncharacterized protein n=1 Tax=Tanacetum coccineum TaxID=301880 RepID=A0ABQ5EVI3_9ASTR